MSAPTIVFFGTPHFATIVADELERAGLTPALVVTAPDAPAGRGRTLTPPAMKTWADERGIPVLQPENLKDTPELAALTNTEWDLFVLASYGKIIPETLLELPTHGTLNVHPSLLPRFRGANPVRAAILADARETGVTIMLMDEELDHGPIVSAARIELTHEDWPPKARVLEELLATAGGELLAETIPPWIRGELTPEHQEHAAATYTQKTSTQDAQVELDDDPYQNLLKIRAYEGAPGAYFFTERGGRRVRVKITDAEIAPDGSLRLLRVIPEGKREMPYEDFLRGG